MPKKPPLRHRLARQAFNVSAGAKSFARYLLGIGTSRGGSDESAPPFVGPAGFEAMRSIPTVYRAITVKANDKARVPLVIGRRGPDGAFKPLPAGGPKDGPRQLFETVNPNEGPVSFWTRAFQMEQIEGNQFIQLERLKGTHPQELWLLQSDDVTIRKGPKRRPAGYELKSSGGLVTFRPEDVFHTKLPFAGDDWRGLPPLVAAEKPGWLQLSFLKHSVELLAHGATMPGFVSFKDQYVEADQRNEVREEVRRLTGGSENAGRAGILWAGAEWEPTGITSRDGDFMLLSDEAKELICAVYGVPPAYVFNLKQAKYDNMEQQQKLYWFSTLIPELIGTAQDLTAWLRLEYSDDTLEAFYDLDRVEAIQELRLVKAEGLQRMVAGGLMTQNEARAQLGLPKATGGDALYFPQALQPTGTVVIPQPAKALPAFGRKAWLDDPARHAKRDESKRDMGSYVPEVERRVIDLERRVEAQIKVALLKASPARGKADFRDVDWEAILSEFLTMLGSAYAKIISSRGQATLDGVVDGDIFDLTVPGVTEWLETVGGEQAKLIVSTLKDQLAEVLAAGAEGEDTATTIAARLAELFDLRRSEANRIAWTETGKAYNFGTLEGFRQSEVVAKKEWLAVDDEHTRDAHREADGQVVGLEEFFLVDGELLEFPGAPGASAGNAINCRCAMQPVIDDDAKALKQLRKRSRIRLSVKDLDELFAEPSLNGNAK